jgi:YD repeat-containing protein
VINKIAGACALGALLAVSPAAAQTLNWGEEYAKRVKATEQVSPLGDDAFGDQINLFNGTVSFTATDIAIPGNSALAVELVRSFDTQDVSSGRPMAQWDLDLPRLSAVHPASQPWAPAQRCSTVASPPSVTNSGYTFLSKDYWSGTKLQTRRGGGDLLAITSDPKLVRPGSPHDFKWVTKDGWFFSCLALRSGHEGEGFLAHAPDGTRYYFDWMVQRPYPRITKKDASKLETGVLDRVSVRLYATKVEDRFGNWVQYDWSGDRLLRIHADDGREITLKYDPASGRLTSASAVGRTWVYEYTSNGAGLAAVVNPDASRWEYGQGGTGQLNRIEYEPDPQEPYSGKLQRDDENYCWPTNKLKVQAPRFLIAHPAGATAEYTFLPLRHGRTNVKFRCVSGTDDDWRTDYNDFALTHEVMSLKSKRVTGPGLAESVSTYDYSGLEAGYAPFNAETDAVTGATPPPHYEYVTVTRPDGSRLVNRFGKDYGLNEGQLMQADVYDAQGVLKRSTLNTYVSESEATAGPFPASMGHNLVWSGDPLGSAGLRPLKRSAITQDGTQFSTETEQFDPQARPLRIYKSSSLGYAKRDATSYHDDTVAWVLGQVASVNNIDTGKQVNRIRYDSRSQPWMQYGFDDLLQSTSTYHLDGTLETVTDANQNKTELTGWRRGIPQQIRYADGAIQGAVVKDDGTIEAVTDAEGHTTSYTYDAMGRLTSITHPGDSNITTLAFEPVASDEYGIPAGHWRQLVLTGNGHKYTYFDGLWRPLLTREYDAADIAATQRFQRFTYDYAGRTTFASYFAAGSSAVTGTWSEYDALGRITSSSQDSEHGLLTTLTEYLPGFKTRVTNPRGFSTVTEYQAYGEPDTSAPVRILAPERTTTTIERDTFGKPTSLVRSESDN